MTGPGQGGPGGEGEPPQWGTPQPDATPPGAPPPPPGAPQSPSSTPEWSSAPWIDPNATPPPKKRPKALLLGVLGLGAALIATVGGKFLLGFLAASVVGSAVSGLFGGPWDRLPSDVRSGYEQRLEAAVGKQLEGLSDADAKKKVEDWLAAGYLRLDDGRLIRHLDLEIEALGRAEEATCAAFGREAITGQTVSDDTGSKLISSLEQPALVEWIGLNVDAIEAELRGSPNPTRITDDESTAVLNELIEGLGQGELETFAALDSGGTATDAEVCHAVRLLYNTAKKLDPDSKAIMARFDVQP
jgi:hypothetical protein